jgi:hypothetical protein
MHFENGTQEIYEKEGWRDDMRFLHHLTEVFKFNDERKCMPLVKFQKLPHLSNARWNSRAILALLAYILNPAVRNDLEVVCRFISYDSAQFWFADQLYKENDFKSLSEILKKFKKAPNVLANHWNNQPSVINIPRSNQCAERAVKVMKELYNSCKNKDNLQLRVIFE